MSQFITYNSIIGNGKSYQIPIYQRDYSWTKDDWEDLWNDILDIPTDKSHYLGYLVLQPNRDFSGEEAFWVIDGQQRLTTLSIIALAVIHLLKRLSDSGVEAANNKVRYEKETERYLGNFSTSRMTLSPKLTLNRNNDDYYKSWLLQHRTPPVLSKLKPSQVLLQKAFNYFLKQLEDKFMNGKSGAELTDFLEKTIGNGIEFTQIIVQNDLDAFKVFETLNARGVKLSTGDLLKNYLFRLTAQKGELDLDEAERRWQSINDTLRNKDMTTYLRHFWNSRYKLERQPTLFKAIRKKIITAEEAYVLLDDLEQEVQYYAAFVTPSDDIWNDEERKHLQVLNLLEVTTCYSLMLSCLRFLPRNEFKTLLRELAVISFRYNIMGLNPNEAERVFSSVGNEVAAGGLKAVRDIVVALKSIYVEDDNFAQAFATVSISTKRKKELVKYILIKLENQISNTDLQYEDAIATIEHILPENPGSVWEDSFPVDIQLDYIYRLGNYSLLAASVNNKRDNNSPFSVKLIEYEKSSYKLSSEYCLYDAFTPSALNLRQKRLSALAKTIWKSAYLK